MSESNVKEVTCKECGKKVPAGKFCSECGVRIVTESRGGVTNDEPRPPIQASDELPTYGGKVSRQQITVTFDASTNNSDTYPSNKMPEISTATVTMWSTYHATDARAVQHLQQNIQQNRQSSSLAIGNVAEPVTYVHSDPSKSMDTHGHRDNSERSGAQPITPSGAPRTPNREKEGNSLHEGQYSHDTFYDSNIQTQWIYVQFHVIIPFTTWDWNDHCCLGVNFYQPRNFIIFPKKLRTQYHWAKYDAVQVTVNTTLPSSYLNKKIPYKYSIQYPNGSTCLEYIRDLPVQEDCNRCLELKKGMHHVYDGFIFPTQSWHEKIINYITKVNINTKELHGYALLIYLQSKASLVTTEMTMTSSTITDLCDKVLGMYFYLDGRSYMFPHKDGSVYSYCTDELLKGLEEWFIETIEYLGSHQCNADIRRRWSASIVMALVTIIQRLKMKPSFSINVFQSMFAYLCLGQDNREDIVSLIATSLRNEIANGIAYVCSLSIAHDKADNSCHWYWLYAIPLLHQLQPQDSATHAIGPDNVDWGIHGLDKESLQDFKSLVQKKRTMKNIFADANIDELMKSDHLLLRLLVYLSTEDDVDVILDHQVHIPECIFALHVSNQSKQYDVKKSQKMCHALEKLCHITISANGEKNRFYCTMVAAKRTLDNLANTCNNHLDHVAALHWAIKLYFVALSAYITSEREENVSSYITDAQTTFIAWFKNPSTGFEDYFGGKDGNNIKKEITLWKDALALVKTFQLLPCISKEWKLQMKQIIQDRINNKQVYVYTKVNIALEICNSNEIDSVFSDIVWESIAMVMEDDALMKTQGGNDNNGALLSQLLIKYYVAREINLATLVSFRLWPEYLKHFVSNDKLAKGYTEQCTRKCNEAREYILQLIEKLKIGSVTVEELCILISHTSQAVKLFSIVSTSTDFSQIIAQRKNELEKFNLHHCAIKVLIKYCEDISEDHLIKDLQENLEIIELEEVFSELKISGLYEVINGNEVYAILDINDTHVVEMLQPFAIMMHECKSVISEKIWHSHVAKKAKLSLPEIALNIWAPCFEDIQQLIERFCDRSVSLQEIDHYLKNISSPDLRKEIFNLVEGCNKCLNQTSPTTWIPHFVDSVNHYRIIDKAKDLADVVLAIKDVLKMNDGFDKLKNCQVKLSGRMSLSLEEFEREEYDFEDLEAIASDKNKVEFLKVLSISTQLIEWLRRETKDVTELHNLVGLSLLEDNVHKMDRIAQLHTVGSAIAPLVYKLEVDGGLHGFLKACEPIWKAIEANPRLPNLFKTCCDELSLVKLSKDLQAPIEFSTYDQIREILESGKYNFGSKRFRIFISTEEIIKLRVKNSTSSKETYTLTELQELESKIVLIRDHRSPSDKLSADEIEYFLDTLHLALHIADTLLKLQRAGHPQYIEWLKSFDFETTSQNNLQKDLQILNRNMKNDLQDWLNKVSNFRTEYYALNYFTCLQLLRINREFYTLVNSNDHQISREVFVLLMSISPDLTIMKVKEVVSTAKHQLVTPKSMNSSIDCDDSTYIIDEVDIPGEVAKFTEEEKEVYQSSIDDYNFEPCIVIAAIRKCGANEDAVATWCFDSENQQMFRNATKGGSSSAAIQIDTNNAIVQELVDMKFPEALSIEAVKHYGEDLAKCMDYCSNQILAGYDNISDADTDDESILLECAKSDVDLSEAEDSYSAITSEMLKYFDLKDMGILLDNLAKEFTESQSSRRFIRSFEKGTPNFLSVPSCAIFKTVISIYAQEKSAPLPSLEEILVCNQRTTVEEISLLWYRAARDPGYRRIFCLVNGEKLSYQVCVKALELMDEILKEITDYRLVIICSNDAKDKRSYIMDHLQYFCRDALAVTIKDDIIYKYLNYHMRSIREFESAKEISASDVDPGKCAARVIRSERAGMGKSLYVSRLTNKLKERLNQSNQSATYSLCITIPVHGPTVNNDEIMKSLQHSFVKFDDPEYFPPQIFHFDIASSELDQVDALLFSMVVLKGFNDGSGNVWRCFPNQLYLIEATYELVEQDEESDDEKKYCNTVEFLKLIPSITCCSPRDSLVHDPWRKDSKYWDDEEISSAYYQRPHQYLIRLSDELGLDNYSFANSTGSLASGETILHTVLKHFGDCGVADPSWMELKHFLSFLNAQFEDCENSTFCNVEHTGYVLPGFKAFVVKFMLKMSKDFAVPSLNNKVKDGNFEDTKYSSRSLVELNSVKYSPSDASTRKFSVPRRFLYDELFESDSDDDLCNGSTTPITNPDAESDTDVIGQLQIHSKRVWNRNFHPYIFFNMDHISMTFIGFTVRDNGDLIDPATRRTIHRHLFTSSLLRGLRAQRVYFTDYGVDDQKELLNKLFMVMGIDNEKLSVLPDNSYVLTADNTKKILAILMRFRCNIPVVLMGETGCGKTRLIKYMCHLLSLNSARETLVIMKVHGGVTGKDIISEVCKARKLAKRNAKNGLETVMFFDEANTTEAIGLIKEIMCDKRIRGKPIKENIKFIAACNPYRKHSPSMIQKLENAGLGYYVHSANTKQKLGSIPLRHLVYRVLDLPSSMQSLVYDFGQLNTDTERSYAEKIVENYEQRIKELDVCRVTDVLMACQDYMKKTDDECSFVSLRDIERAMIVLEWFHKVLDFIEKDDSYTNSTKKCDRHTRALVLTIAVCYYTKLQHRDAFEKLISSYILRNTVPLDNDDNDNDDDNDDDDNNDHDDDYDDDDEDDDDDDAVMLLREEIIKCQEVFLRNMKIPPFIACNAALRENVFMMVVCIELKIPLFLVGKPGSSKSLAKSIVADSMQGAASSNPLFQRFKQVQLFSYQCSEHSTSETILEVFDNAVEFQKKKEGQNCVSVVVLDEVGLAEDSPSLPLKTLHPLLEDGTIKSNNVADRVAFIGISNWALDPAKMNRGIMVTRSDPKVDELVISARGICISSSNCKEHENLSCFFDPFADAYLKVCSEQAKTNNEFYGLRDFYSLIKMMYTIFQKNGCQKLTINQLMHCLKRNFDGKLNCDIIAMFLENVSAKDIGEATNDRNYDSTSLGLIKASLQCKDISWHGENRYLLLLTENYSALRILKEANILDHEPLVLFGSSFPQDLNYTQVCRNINQIKFCMDTGRTVILLNLEHLYASLYDLLNQYYITLSNTRYVDLGLQSHRIKCRVHPEFKLVLIADRDRVYEQFPIPLINRLEKHYLVTSTILSKKQEELMNRIEKWVEDFSKVSTTIVADTFTPKDAFVGYQYDTPASVVFKVWQDLKLDDAEPSGQWEEKALQRSKEYLLRIATPDSIVRCKHSENLTKSNQIMLIYFNIHSYVSLGDFLNKKLNENSGEGLIIQITTNASLLQYKNLLSIQESTDFSKDQISLLMLQQFDTEIDFCSKIRSIFQRESADDHLLIVQCDSGHQHIDLIACARYRVLDEAVHAAHLNRITHIVFIIGLPRISGGTVFVSFQGGNWESYHMDSLMSPKDSFFTIKQALNMSIYDILLECYNSDKELFHRKIQSCISPTSLLQFSNVPTEYTLRRYYILSELVAKNHYTTENEGIKESESLHQLNYQYDFCGALHQHIFKTLKAKRNTDFQLHNKEWAINEAIKHQDLHRNGSFKNVLFCKVDQKIIIVLNVILNAVDKYCNLHLLGSEVCVISNLWFKIFEDGDLFLNVTTELENITAGNKNIAFTTFKCQFPFFWLFISSIENKWKICASQNHSSLDVYNILSTNSKSLINKLKVVSEDAIEAVFKCYVHDFVLYFFKSSEESDSTKIYEQTIYKEYRKIAQNVSPDDLLHQMILLHIAYHNIENCLHRLKRIMVFNPEDISSKLPEDISSKLQSYFTEESSIEIDLYAVQKLLGLFQPNFKEWTIDDCKHWLHNIRGFQNIIDATIIANTGDHSAVSAINRIWNDWQLLRVLQIFVEHTLEFLPSATMLYAMRINKFLSKDHNFTKLVVYERLKSVVVTYAKDMDTKKISTKESCNALFLEIISEVIFATTSSLTINEPPEDDLVSELLKMVISKQQLSPFSDSQSDKILLIRSHFLQLLLDYDKQKVRSHLQDYFTKSFDLLSGDVNFLVLCIQCFEDSYHKQANNGPSLHAIRLASNLLEQANECIDIPDVMTLDYVESVAKFRYTLETVAWLLHDYYLDPARVQLNKLSKDESRSIAKLMNLAKGICSPLDEHAPKDVADFLVKCIVRKHGMSTLMMLCNTDNVHADFSWLIPKHLQNDPSKNKKDNMIDPFVIYGKKYVICRNSLVALQEESVVTSFEKLNFAGVDAGIIVLALHGAIAMYHISDSNPSVFDTEGFKEYIDSSVCVDDPLRAEITSQLIDNIQHSDTLLAITLEKNHYDQQLCTIVVHTAVVIITCSTENSLLSPLQHFIHSSASLKSMYFPTMPHDELYETTAITTIGKFYKCKNGHPYAVTECGRPTQLTICRVCQEPIGGNYELTPGNIEYQREDTTQTGHLLGPAQHLIERATPERDLSPVACTIIRLIMHAALVWSSVYVGKDPGIISDVIHPTVNSEDVPQFLWQHLIRDLELLSKVIGYSVDDAALIVHLILQKVHNSTTESSHHDLFTKESRRKWEQQFSTMYVQPILNDMRSKLQTAQELVTNDDKQTHNILLQTVYEKNADNKAAAIMWRYRSPITIEHIGFFIEQQKSIVDCPVLKEFLKQEIRLRATQYLPDIIQLQQFFAKLYNVNVDDEQVNKLTVMDLHQESDVNTLIKLVESFYSAWILVKPFLLNYGVQKELVAEMANDPQHISLAYLIPTKTGKGICSTALVDFLVTIHNEFICFCHEQVNTKILKQTLPLHELQSCYLVANERQFMSIVMSHCHYSLTRGKAIEVHYDLPALEKHFLGRFVYGKPLFDRTTACVMHQHKYIHNSESFTAIRRNTHPQKLIAPETKRLIIEELHDSQILHEVLEMVNTILTILASHTSTDSASRNIGEYAEEILKRKVPTKIAACTLGNIISLWETLAVEQARRAVLANQDIFKEIDDNFKQQLDWTEEDESKFRSSLKRFHTDKLLGLLYQFIVLFIRDQSKSRQSKDWPLVDTFPVFLEQEEMGDPGIGAMFKTSFPKSITLSYIVDVWKKIVISEVDVGKRNTS